MILAPPRFLFETEELTMGTISETREILVDNRLESLADQVILQAEGIGPGLEWRGRHLLPKTGDSNYVSRVRMGWDSGERLQVVRFLTEARDEFERVLAGDAQLPSLLNKVQSLLERWQIG